MKMTKWIMVCLLAVALVPVGCSKKESQQSAAPQAVTIDVPKLRDAFATAAPDLKALADRVIRNVQFGRSYSAGLADLDKLANSPGLTDDQKKVVADVTDQVKKMMSSLGTTPAQ
jgi:ABC-type Fe3+-citrate transport system substrate-binding protein